MGGVFYLKFKEFVLWCFLWLKIVKNYEKWVNTGMGGVFFYFKAKEFRLWCFFINKNC